MFEEINSEHKEKILELFEELNEFYEGSNWLVVKKYLIRYLRPDIRKYFSTRHSKTKKHTLNFFEQSFIKFCSDNYSVHLKLNEEDKHYEQ